MNKEFERYLVVLLILILIGLSGCVSKQKNIETDMPIEDKVPTVMETIGKLDAIVEVLGCMFDPRPCQTASKTQDEEFKNANSE